MHRIGQATDADRKGIEDLWLAAFPEDTPDDVIGFWNCGFTPEQATVCKIDGQIVSMAFLLPATLLMPSGDSIAVGYLFAAATLPTFRGQGLASKVIDTLHAHAIDIGMQAVFLRPAESTLFDFYARFGYRTAFYTHEYTLSREEMEKIASADNADVALLTAPSEKRQKWLKDREIASVNWGDSVWRYATHPQDGGRYTQADAGWMALCEEEQGHLTVRELLCDDDELPAVYAHLCREYRFSSSTIRRPTTDKTAPFGMIKPLDPTVADQLISATWYMGPALD